MSSDLRQILMDIRESHGTLSPAVVLDDARAEDHPLHNRFEWDNHIAGEKWRLHQAGDLIRSVKIRRHTDGGTQELRAFWPVHQTTLDIDGADEPTADYRPIQEVIEDPITRQLMLNSMIRDANSFRRRYSHMQEFSDIVLQQVLGDDGNGNGSPPPDRETA